MTARGFTEPRIYTPPLRELTENTSLGFLCIAFARDVLGRTLYPWQEWLLVHMLEIVDVPVSDEFPLGWRLRFRVVLVLVARQNGKTTISEVVVEFFLFILKVLTVVGTSLSLDKAEETWENVVADVESIDELAGEMSRKPRRTNGKYKLYLSGGRTYNVKATGTKAGRGDPIDLGLLDELREQKNWKTWSAMLNATNASPNGMLLCLTNAGDVDAIVLRHIRNIALASLGIGDSDDGLAEEGEEIPDGDDVAIFEWSAPDGASKTDEEALAQANPALGYGRLTMRALKTSARTSDDTEFRTEVLCQILDAKMDPPFGDGVWEMGIDEDSCFSDDAEVALGIDVSADRRRTAIAGAGRSPDGLWHVEVMHYQTGSLWVVRWLRRYVEKYGPVRLALQSRGAPVASIRDELADIDGVEVVDWEGANVAGWTGRFYDGVLACDPDSDSDATQIRHITQPALDAAAAVAATRSAGDSARFFNRSDSPKDISPLVACVAAFGCVSSTDAARKPKYESAYKGRQTGLVVV